MSNKTLWLAANIVLTMCLMTSCSYDFVRGVQGTPLQREMERTEDALFQMLMATDPVRNLYDQYDREVARIDSEIIALEKERDAIPEGTVIGKRGVGGTRLVGRARQISEGLLDLRMQRDAYGTIEPNTVSVQSGVLSLLSVVSLFYTWRLALRLKGM